MRYEPDTSLTGLDRFRILPRGAERSGAERSGAARRGAARGGAECAWRLRRIDGSMPCSHSSSLGRRAFVAGGGGLLIGCTREASPPRRAVPTASTSREASDAGARAGGDAAAHALFDAYPALAKTLPRVPLGGFPSAIERAASLAPGSTLYIKRDDELHRVRARRKRSRARTRMRARRAAYRDRRRSRVEPRQRHRRDAARDPRRDHRLRPRPRRLRPGPRPGVLGESARGAPRRHALRSPWTRLRPPPLLEHHELARRRDRRRPRRLPEIREMNP